MTSAATIPTPPQIPFGRLWNSPPMSPHPRLTSSRREADHRRAPPRHAGATIWHPTVFQPAIGRTSVISATFLRVALCSSTQVPLSRPRSLLLRLWPAICDLRADADFLPLPTFDFSTFRPRSVSPCLRHPAAEGMHRESSGAGMTGRPTAAPLSRTILLGLSRPTDPPTHRPTDPPTHRPSDLPTFRPSTFRPLDFQTFRLSDRAASSFSDLPTSPHPM
jgi:hypothetical protein